jgi:hypothetical protein
MVYTLLLPVTINVNNCYALERSNPNERYQDFITSLIKWLDNTDFRLVIVENSNIDLTFLDILKQQYSNRIEYFSFDGNTYPRHFGKGYGEMLTINYAIDNSKFISEVDYVFKCSGRYYLTELINVFKEKIDDNIKAVIYSTERHPLGASCVFFYLKKDIYEKYMRNFIVNDIGGVYFEHGLENTIKNIPLENVLQINRMGIEGISGTANRTVDWMT